MITRGIFTAVAAMAASFVGPSALSVADMPMADMGGGRPNTRRGKGKQAKPRKRPNRLTISKRVRRKHRRQRLRGQS